MKKELSKKLQDLDAEGKLETYKSVVANAANFSISDNTNVGGITPDGVLTTGGIGQMVVPGQEYYTYPANQPIINTTPAAVPAIMPTPNVDWDLGSQTLTFPVPASGQELLGMLVEGKDLVKDKDEFLDVIMRLPSVGGNNLKAIEVYERLRKLAIATGLVDADITGDKEKEKSTK